MKLDERYNRAYADLNENDKYIWDYLNTHRDECASLSINDFASRCNVSRTTILRFAKKLGYSGYSELKMLLRQELKNRETHKTSAMHTIVGLYNDVIKSTVGLKADDIFKLFDNSKNLYVYSTGSIQRAVAEEFKRIFLSAGLLFYEIEGEVECETLLSQLGKDDCVVMVSYTGESKHAVELAKQLRIRNVPTVSVTALRENQLSRLTTHSLYVSSADIESNALVGEYTSLSGFFILVEMLFMKYLDYKQTQQEKVDGSGTTDS